MILCVDVTKATILSGRRADKVSLHTTEDSPIPGITKQPLRLEFIVAAGDGFCYVTEVLKIDDKFVEIIHA